MYRFLTTCALLVYLSPTVTFAQGGTMPPADVCAGDASATVIPAGTTRTFSGTVNLGCVSVYGNVVLSEGTTFIVRTLHTHANSTFTATGRAIEIRTSNSAPTDGEQFGTGLIFEGQVQIAGLPQTPWTRLTEELPVGASVVTVADSSGWKVGDRLIIPDTRDIYSPAFERTRQSGPEYFTIAAINAGVITLDRPAQLEHPGARNADGSLTGVFPPVGNLSRSITIRSAEPRGVRGHMMITHGATGSIRNVAILDFGRTTNDPLNNATNHMGRYAAHIHMASTPGFVFAGNVVRDYLKWGITVHGTNGQVVRDNVVVNGWGAGIMTEDGTERDNDISKNLIVQTVGTNGRGDERRGEPGVNGSCVWLQGPLNRVDDNVAANCLRYGFTIWGKGCVPSFARNEAIASETGLSPWYTGSDSCTSYFDAFKAWHVANGRFNYPTTNLTFRDTWMRNDPRHQRQQYWSAGITAGDYDQRNLRDIRPDVQNMRTAISVPYGNLGDHPEPHTYEVIDAKLDGNLVNVHQPTPSGAFEPRGLAPHTVILRNVQHGTTRAGGVFIEKLYRPTDNANFIQLQRLVVERHNGVPGSNFEVFYKEQAPDFVVPATGLTVAERNLTNSQAWAKYRQAVAGAVATCTTTRAGETNGFLCPVPSIPGIGDLPPAPPGPPRNVRLVRN